MRENGIRARHKRRFKATTDSKHALPVAPNLLDRNFTPAAPNQVWTADITYLWTDEGWLYLAIVLDLFNREVVGWSIKPRMTADIVIDALTMAWFRRKPAPGVIHHSDRGSQYASHAFQEKLTEYGMTCSMSRKGNCWDNAPTESWFNSLKNERVHGVRYATRPRPSADLSSTSRCSTTGNGCIRRSATSRRSIPGRLDQRLSMSNNWRHNADGLEDKGLFQSCDDK